MEVRIKELQRRANTAGRVNLPGRPATGCHRSQQSIEHNQETSVSARHHNTLTAKKRRPPVSLRRGLGQ